jgi:hypothetical protein
VIALFPKIGRAPSPKNSEIREGPLALIRGLHGIASTKIWYLLLLLLIIMIKLPKPKTTRVGGLTDSCGRP